MSLLIDTTAVDEHDRVVFWADASRNAYHPLDIQPSGAERFRGRMWGDTLASLGVYRINMSANTMRRTQQHIAAGDDESVHVSIVLRGRLQTTQEGRVAVQEPGDITAYNTSQPATFSAGGDFDLLVFKLPRSTLGAEVADKLARRTAMRIRGHSGMPRVASHFFCDVAAGLADGSLERGDIGLAEQVVDLVRRLYVDLDGAALATSPARADLAMQARKYVLSHLGEPSLSPEEVAAACFVSTRHLQRVFADEQRTVAEWIRSERLRRCRRDLGNPALADQPIAVIAARWGLPNAPHFSRVFHSAYGCSPREFRKRALNSAS
jgi:AraC-like DNA-binding protein